jgi:hypothetical protein
MHLRLEPQGKAVDATTADTVCGGIKAKSAGSFREAARSGKNLTKRVGKSKRKMQNINRDAAAHSTSEP